jgi:hypothetical protein
MVKIFIFCILLFFNSLQIFSQDDRIELEIENLPDSKYETILKARHLLKSCINSGDISKIKRIKDYIESEIAEKSIDLYSKPRSTLNIKNKPRSLQFYSQLKYNRSNYVFSRNCNDFNGVVHQVCITIGGLSRRILRNY